MKLFYSTGSCSLASHIILNEIDTPFTIEKVDLKAKTSSLGDFTKINPKGYVPVLELESGEFLTEGAVILQYLADKYPEKKLAPSAGTMPRYRLQEWLNYIATEVHKHFSILWNQKFSEETKAIGRDFLQKKFDFLNKHFEKSTYLTGDQFTVADAYLFTVLNWANFLKMDLSPWTNLKRYVELVEKRPSVQKSLKAEGLSKAA